MDSCIYAGQVRHRRFAPQAHSFRYGLYLIYLDLDELPELFDRFWVCSARRFNLAWFRRSDHLGDPARPLVDAVRNRVEQATGARPEGPVRLLTQLRYLGYGFNPVSFYYCFSKSANSIDSIVAEVSNTPWGERHVYVLSAQESDRNGKQLRFRRKKQFHVSPFMPMDIDYDWRFSMPGEKLNVHMVNYRHGGKLFDATLTLERSALTSQRLAILMLRSPMITLKVIGGIYYEALRLWLKNTPFYAHP